MGNICCKDETPNITSPFPSATSSRPWPRFEDTKARRWLSSFYRSDPRHQVYRFFSGQMMDPASASAPSVFTVWRPTSAVAIRRMIVGEAVGKGLEIKGKSAKAGRLSGYVPFLQIHQEGHKSRVKTIPRGGRTRIFYATAEERDAVAKGLGPYQDQMLNAVQDAKRIVKKSVASVGKVVGADIAVSTIKKSGQEIAKQTGAAVSSLGGAAALGASLVGNQAGAAVSSIGNAIGADGTMPSIKASVIGIPTAGRQASAAVASSVGSAIGSDAAMSSLKNTMGMMSVKGLGISQCNSKIKEGKESEYDWALKRLLWDMDDPSIRIIDTYAPQCYGIELPDRLLWQAFVVNGDISRPEGSEHYTARPSQPAFQDMNFIAIYKTRKNQTAMKKGDADEARVVLWHASDKDEELTDPRCLIMAYEENGRVLPVVSDFDCFTMGTRGLEYETPLPGDQVELLLWCVSQIEEILEKQQQTSLASSSWTSCWLEVLKASAVKGFHPEIPRFGFGDEKSYSITERAVSWLEGNGAVRHGAECFNYYFPQELDNEFLIVSDSLPGKVPWKYVDTSELRDFLLQKIDEGFTFPLNPKWVLCDEGWKVIYDRLLSSNRPHVQDSLDVWFPPDSGIRQCIEAIHARHPRGFVCPVGALAMTGTEAMDLATLELDQFLALRRAKAKVRAIIAFNELLNSVRRNRERGEDGRTDSLSGTHDIKNDT